MKHKHSEIIKAKADDMGLVLLSKGERGWKVSVQDFPLFDDLEYWLCRSRHEDACLHWLNGGKAQLYSGDRFCDMPMYDGSKWHLDLVFMDKVRETRIKPKKEKRWIFIDKQFGFESSWCSNAYPSRELAMKRMEDWTEKGADVNRMQIIEIEVEV